ncbi:MAG: hypothetical protein PWR08_1652 [Thermoanaerobacterium sp.]|nr:hypothetical protein [Thermoanaerobacterium sp.]
MYMKCLINIMAIAKKLLKRYVANIARGGDKKIFSGDEYN